MDKAGTSDPYAVIKSNFNKQQFKSKVIKKTLSPEWNQQFEFYTSKPTGHIMIKIWDKDRLSDDFLGEVAIPVKKAETGEVVDEWYRLENEPKKKKDKNQPGAEIRVKLHYPSAKPTKAVTVTVGEIKTDSTQKETTQTSEKSVEKSVRDCYEFGKELGRGGFSVVREGTNKETGDKVAIKVIEKNNLVDGKGEELNLLHREIDIMKKLHHKNIIALVDVFEEPTHIYIILELITGGELFDQIVKRGSYGESDAANLVRQILEAVQYMHSNGIAHRDLKPENLLCSGKDNDIIKVTDFGLSKDFGADSLRTSCGTPDYVAPEVLKGMAYDNSVDIWSIGVITYILLCGFPPFYGSTDQQIFEKIMKAEFDFPSPDWDSISPEAKDFVQKILVLDPTKRLSTDDCVKHPWITSKAPSRQLERIQSFRGQMKNYVNNRAKLKN